jgi:uncharacterized protein YeaO (DUF488 family)
MSITTGYFGGVKKPHQHDIVSIAAGQPRWLQVLHKHSALAPRYTLLKDFRSDFISESQYVTFFNAMLDKLNPAETLQQLNVMSQSAIMCCHCKTTDFCHRHLVAEWLESNLDITIHEHNLGRVTRSAGRIITTPQPQQQQMF